MSSPESLLRKLYFPDSIGASTQMVIVNAIYFKGLWAAPFRQTSTKVETFNLRNGAKKNVPFMMIRRHFRAGIDKQTDAKVVILPFEVSKNIDENFWLLLVAAEM